jgi:uncharacterized membrane protein HdeD (DUF308 family)
MVGFNSLVKDKKVLDSFSQYSKLAGIIFMILGVLGITFPVVMSLTTAYFVAWLLLFGGITLTFHTYKTNKKDWLGWFKAFIFILSGALTIVYPTTGVAALGIILATYLFMDGFVSFALAIEQKPQKGWWIILINSITSVILGAIFIIGWPFNSIFLVGLYIGISLLFDGVVLLSMSSAVKKLDSNN